MIKYIIGGLVAIVLLMASFMIYERVSKQNDVDIAQRVYEAEHMSTNQINSYKGNDAVIKAEQARRHKEIMETIRRQNRE